LRFRNYIAKPVMVIAPLVCIHLCVESYNVLWAYRYPEASIAQRTMQLSNGEKSFLMWMRAIYVFSSAAPPFAMMAHLWRLCLARITVVIQYLEYGPGIDWNAACQGVDTLDQDLASIWAFGCAGGLWSILCLRSSIAFLLLALAPSALARESGFNVAADVIILPYIILCLFTLASIFFLVASVSQLTTRCSSTLTSQRSIVNAARACFGRCCSMSLTERLQYQNFMALLTAKPRGIELGGILLVTVERSLLFAFQILLHSPVLYAMLVKFAQETSTYN